MRVSELIQKLNSLQETNGDCQVMVDDVYATSSASYIKYNGEELKKHIVSVEVLVSNVLRDTWNLKDLNPDYKGEDETYTDEDGNHLNTVG